MGSMTVGLGAPDGNLPFSDLTRCNPDAAGVQRMLNGNLHWSEQALRVKSLAWRESPVGGSRILLPSEDEARLSSKERFHAGACLLLGSSVFGRRGFGV